MSVLNPNPQNPINDIEAFITGYGVQVTSVAGENRIEFSLVDPCNTQRDPCAAKALLVDAAKQYLAQQGIDEDIIADCCGEKGCCPGTGPNSEYVYGTQTFTVFVEGGNVSVSTFIELYPEYDCSATLVFV